MGLLCGENEAPWVKPLTCFCYMVVHRKFYFHLSFPSVFSFYLFVFLNVKVNLHLVKQLASGVWRMGHLATKSPN